ncbi:hypothetical protein C0580_00435 [Candidatus Parcubacteria bacterium]|nr:MAG: hypothetical protein C0580_00435 [Candidatus Parcubacteria bacterium]
MFQLSTLVLIGVWLVNFSLLIFILTNKHKLRKWPIFTMVFLLVLWQSTELANIIWLIDNPYLIHSVRAGLLPTLYIAPAFIWLVYSLFDKWSDFSFWQKFVWWIPAVVMSPFVFSVYNLKDLMIMGTNISYTPGGLYFYFSVYFVLLMTWGLVVLIQNRKRAIAIVRRQIDYIFVATALTAIFAITFNVVLPLFGQHDFYYVGVNSVVIFTSIVTYALFRYRFIDLRISTYRVIIDLVRLIIIAFIYYIVYLVLYALSDVSFDDFWSVGMFVVFVGLTAPFLFRLISKLLLSLLIDPTDDIKKSEDKVAEILRSSRDMNVLFSHLTKEIGRVIDFTEIFIYLAKKDNPKTFYQVFPVGERLLSSDSETLQHLSAIKEMANKAEIDYLKIDKTLSQELAAKQIDVALPIFYNKQLLGVVLLDNSRKLLSVQQINFLYQINKYLDIAVGSLLMYQQAMADER